MPHKAWRNYCGGFRHFLWIHLDGKHFWKREKKCAPVALDTQVCLTINFDLAISLYLIINGDEKLIYLLKVRKASLEQVESCDECVSRPINNRKIACLSSGPLNEGV